MNLDEETGISIMKIVPKLDAGPIMMRSKIRISKDINYENLVVPLALLIIKALKVIMTKKIILKIRMTKMQLMQKRLKNESKINWNDKAEKRC